MRPHILAVEDDFVAGKLLRLLCHRFGYDVSVMPNAVAAINALKDLQSDFAIILMEWQLGSESGLDCTRQIRQLEQIRGGHIPIVAVTANALSGHRDACLEAGMDDYLSKPYSMDEFEAMLVKWGGPGKPTHR